MSLVVSLLSSSLIGTSGLVYGAFSTVSNGIVPKFSAAETFSSSIPVSILVSGVGLANGVYSTALNVPFLITNRWTHTLIGSC